MFDEGVCGSASSHMAQCQMGWSKAGGARRGRGEAGAEGPVSLREQNN